MKNFFLTVVVAATLAVGCAPHGPADGSNSALRPSGAPQPVAVVDSLEPIEAEFNAHADKPRVVLLVSPTCSERVSGGAAKSRPMKSVRRMGRAS